MRFSTGISRGKYLKNLLNPYLHPHGIKEMAAAKELRVAYAVIHLLHSLEVGEAEDRLGALRSLRDEVLYSAQSFSPQELPPGSFCRS